MSALSKDAMWLRMAREAASESKDPSTKVGAVIVDKRGRSVSTGRNGFPQVMKDKSVWLKDRDEKLSRTIHAEINAILFAHRDLTDCSLYVWPFLPCDRCMGVIAQAGITRIVSVVDPDKERQERWKDSLARSKRIAKDCGIEIIEYVNIERGAT